MMNSSPWTVHKHVQRYMDESQQCSAIAPFTPETLRHLRAGQLKSKSKSIHVQGMSVRYPEYLDHHKVWITCIAAYILRAARPLPGPRTLSGDIGHRSCIHGPLHAPRILTLRLRTRGIQRSGRRRAACRALVSIPCIINCKQR